MSTHTHNQPDNPIARIALASGQVFQGQPFGACNKGVLSCGEVVFNTAMTGYQESITDPSYMGQILVQTQPLIGNTGVNPEDLESSAIQISGLIVHEYTQNDSNYRADSTLYAALDQAGVLGISGIDTRALTRVLRNQGVVQGVMTDRTDLSDEELVDMAAKVESMAGQNLAAKAGRAQPDSWTENLGKWGGEPVQELGFQPTVLVMDFGIKSNIARNLTQRGCRVQIIPHTTSAEEILNLIEQGEAHALFLSNGPGDPDAVEVTIKTLEALINHPDLAQFPIFGICLGHQLLCLAMGAKTYKLPFGHRGANHPVHDLRRGRIQITSQNHGFAVDPDSIEEVGGIMTHIHLDDQTLAGFRHAQRPIVSVQFHPEASPGPHDASPFFDELIELIKVSFGSKSSA